MWLKGWIALAIQPFFINLKYKINETYRYNRQSKRRCIAT